MLDAGGGGGGVRANAKIWTDFARAAAEGSFAVNESGGQALLSAIREMRDWIDGQDFRLSVLQQQPQLGSSHGADTMKPYLQDVASDQQGFITMLSEFRNSLDEAERGINDAMNNYQTMDHGIANRFPTEI